MRIITWLLGGVLILSTQGLTPGMKIGFYQSIPHAKTTLCIDTFGKATIYEGSLLHQGAALPNNTYSLCLETEKNYQELVKAMEFVDVDVSYGALRPR